MSGEPQPKTKPKTLDAFGAFSFGVYVLVGGFLVFGFAYALRGAVDKQESSICTILRPELRSRLVGTVTRGGQPVADVAINPGPEGKSRIVSGADGTFSLMVPNGPSNVTLGADGKTKTFSVTAPSSQDITATFELDGGEDDAVQPAAVEAGGPLMAPEIEAQDLNGAPVKLSDYRGQFVVVNFWATWCEPCITEWPQLHQLAQRLSGRDDVVVLAVSIDNEQEAILPFLERMSLLDTEVQVVWDSSTTVHEKFGSSKIPDTFFVNEDGELASAFVNVRKWGAPEAFHCVDGSIGR